MLNKSVDVNVILGVSAGFILLTSLPDAYSVKADTVEKLHQQSIGNIPAKAIELIKESEGYRATAYKDSAGVWTIGWGTIRMDGKGIKPGQTIDETTAEKYLMEEINHAASAVKKLVKVPINEGQFTALISFVYNTGEGTLTKSTLLKKLNAGDCEGAKSLFPIYNKDINKRTTPGLTKRRIVEQNLFVCEKK